MWKKGNGSLFWTALVCSVVLMHIVLTKLAAGKDAVNSTGKAHTVTMAGFSCLVLKWSTSLLTRFTYCTLLANHCGGLLLFCLNASLFECGCFPFLFLWLSLQLKHSCVTHQNMKAARLKWSGKQRRRKGIIVQTEVHVCWITHARIQSLCCVIKWFMTQHNDKIFYIFECRRFQNNVFECIFGGEVMIKMDIISFLTNNEV